MRPVLLILLLLGCPKTDPVAATDIYTAPAKNPGVPDRPSDLNFAAYDYSPPTASEHRHQTKSGVPVYIAETHEFPLVEITFNFKGGGYLEADDKWGVGPTTAAMLHHGGTTTVDAREVDETFAYLAADVRVWVNPEQSGAQLNCLKDNLDEAFGLFTDLLRNPKWDADKLALDKANRVDRMKQRNDDAGSIMGREWGAMAWGRDHHLGRTSTAAMVESLSAEDLAAFHKTVFNPGNLVIGVTGDIVPDEVLALLDAALDGWEMAEKVADPPAPTTHLEPGLYHVQKDIPQGKVRIGMPGIERDHPDAIALTVMNDILGGGGFTSRLTKRIRSDEGLAYGAASAFRSRVYYPGVFRAGFDSKNPTVALAAKIVLEEVEKIRTEPVSEQELATAKAFMIETFPRRFETRPATVGTFADDELTGRSDDWWASWRDKVEAITAEEVTRVAAEHLDASKLTILVVGDWETISVGDHDGRATMAEFGEVTHLPLRDPLTDEPIP